MGYTTRISDMAISSRIKSLVRYVYQSHEILLHPYYKSEILKSAYQVAWDASFGAFWMAKQGGSCTINEICDRSRKIGDLKREKP